MIAAISGPDRKRPRNIRVLAPLVEVGMTKADIRALAREREPTGVGQAGLGLPLLAHCLR